ncbi:MAG: cytochrome P460 family protein [Planctomycetaceae bacterium]
MRRAVFATGAVAVLMGVIGYQLIAADQKARSTAAAVSDMALPEYDSSGALLRPIDFEKWVVVGTSVGMGYLDGEKADPNNPGQFHNVYLQPQAFDHYVATGEFPEQTVFIVTNNESQRTKRDGDHSVLKSGFFAAPTKGLEVSVKDSRRFPEGWGYYMFLETDQKPVGKERPAGKPYARQACYDCHAEHGATDHVFTQFYSVLTAARKKHLTENPPAP